MVAVNSDHEAGVRAIQLALRADQTELAEDIRTRMELYKAKRPYRELPGSGGVKDPEAKKD